MVFSHDGLDIQRAGHAKTQENLTIARSVGIWGATTEQERWHVIDLPVAEAADLLEATLEQRLHLRIGAWQEWLDRRRQNPNMRVARFDKLIIKLLAERDAKRFHLRGPDRTRTQGTYRATCRRARRLSFYGVAPTEMLWCEARLNTCRLSRPIFLSSLRESL